VVWCHQESLYDKNGCHIVSTTSSGPQVESLVVFPSFNSIQVKRLWGVTSSDIGTVQLAVCNQHLHLGIRLNWGKSWEPALTDMTYIGK